MNKTYNFLGFPKRIARARALFNDSDLVAASYVLRELATALEAQARRESLARKAIG